ncbi:MAG: 16S rRNA (guanine(527)-N(7))-methyltransferase RsmG [Pseudomonadota bacterium]
MRKIDDLLGDVSRETLDDLERLEALVRKWTPKINLISKASVPLLWDRHIRDSAQLWPHVADAHEIVDLGSGGGFPALVLAIFQKALGHRKLIMIESDQRKCAFLRAASQELGLKTDVIAKRIEAAPHQNAHLITARALANCADLFDLSKRHLAPGGRLLLLKGEKAQIEVEEARRDWEFSLKCYPSKTAQNAVILEVGDLRRV